MTHIAPSLLPTGLYDLLPPNAGHERFVSGKLVEAFECFGYEQVAPPLMEFEASLLAGRGAEALSSQTFRVMDPASQNMMGFRPDITLQVGRIASVRLSEHPRPLRLCYSGSTMRVKGEGRERARQWRQAGIELIGAQDPRADAEVIAVSAHSVASLGINDLVVDINFPGLVKLVLQASDIPAHQHGEIESAVECKDAGWIKDADLHSYAADLGALMDAAGEADAGMQALKAVNLPQQGRDQVNYVQAVIEHLRNLDVPVEITIDPVENKGFEYHSLVSFSLFSRAAQSELGRGGRYSICVGSAEEAATGMTLYVNTLMQAVPHQPLLKKILVDGNIATKTCTELHAQGFITIRAIGDKVSTKAAHRLGCTHILQNNAPVALTDSA
ncbi:MAG: ATP phosphoribosyltransferase regulatory subunit [Alphaproteobacteria bacterium]|nr:ATP phosphoribosyltransferase regulatory subunit [Alphaproteobacteria bacterium]